jgi:hypothetical protein
MAKAILMPGLMGLVIFDSAVAKLPLFTTTLVGHSPEIAYLRNGINGFVTDNTVEAYAHAVTTFLESELLQSKLRDGCQDSAKQYTLDAMV